ncbi:helix-turn-helix domain-containing protein [[Lactobacillus] timonensis]
MSKWESGDSTLDLATAVKLAELFDVSLDNLVLGIDRRRMERKIFPTKSC